MHGAMLDFLRNNVNFIRQPRQNSVKNIRRAFAYQDPLSLEQNHREKGDSIFPSSETPDDPTAEALEQFEFDANLILALMALSEREFQAVTLHYDSPEEDGKLRSQKEVGGIMGISESRVSQIIKKNALPKLRRHLADHLDP